MRRALVFQAALLTAALPRLMAGGPNTAQAPDYAQGAPDEAKGRAILDQLRQSGFASGSYYLTFDLREMPRRGDEQVFHGRLWGGLTAAGPVLRILLTDGAGREDRFLLQNGPQARVYRAAGGQIVPVAGAATMAPLIDGVEITPFDLQMPYFYWPNAHLTGINRIRGRPAYAFLFRPPAGAAAARPDVAAVRAYLDTAYPEPVQTELIGPDGSVLKTLSVLDIKKIDGQWMLSSADVRTEKTRNKTRFSLTGAVLGLGLDASVFAPERLAENIAPPTEIEPVNP